MKNILLFFLIIITLNVFSQKLTVNIDEYTKDTISKTTKITKHLGLFETVQFNFIKINSNIYLYISLIHYDNIFSVDTGDVVLIKFKNCNEILALNNDNNNPTIGNIGKPNKIGIPFELIFRTNINSEQLRYLNNYEIDIIKIYTSIGYINIAFNDVLNKKLYKNVELMYN